MASLFSGEAERALALSQALYRQRIVILCVLALLMTGCASTSRVGGGPGADGHRTASAAGQADDEDSWLEAGANGLVAARDKLRSALHRVYQSWAGTPYRYGGESREGVDCSSFVQQTLDTVESFELPRTTVEQARIGLSISKSDLRIGDLVFFKTGRLSRHVGIYLGQGRFMHASSSAGVTISRLDNVYWRHHYWQSRRVTADRGPSGLEPASL
ncbi:NlpC/P60 family protein [uncultured Salinisphaera sp.]|uniref:NlpC/P60 family protein n=1 Tax=uncultured Salinisphaera sp. TaxID=359372 RepID=UPI0032B2EBA9